MKEHDVTLDSRTQGELCRRVEELAASYTPEWRFDRDNPDVGSTLALIFAGQMADNIRRINQLPEKYHTEFTNLLGLTLKSAYPASGVVVAELMQETVPGVMLPRGSRLVADGADGVPILFETMRDVYLTGAKLSDILSLSGTRGRILPLLGGPAPAELVPEPPAERPEGLEEPEQTEPAISLFDYQEQGIERNALLLYHRSVFMGEHASILLQVTSPEGKSLAQALVDERYWRWSYYDGSGLHPFDQVQVQDGAVLLTREGESVPLTVEGSDYHLVCLEALEPIQGTLMVGELRVASLRSSAPPEVILRDGEALEAEKCMPFGDTVSLFDECYICDDFIFSQRDAQVTVSFQLSSQKKMVHLTAQQVHDELKVIKRKPRAVQYEVAYAAPERVALEYYNGQGWRQLPCSSQWSALFDGSHKGEYHICFQCPADWVPVPVNGYEGRSLRLRVTQADDCYLLPCEHTMPVLRNVALSYDYLQPWGCPQRVETVRGTIWENQTKQLLEGEGVAAFAPLPYPAASLYLGFRQPLEGAPISIFFDVEESVHFATEPVAFEYSTRRGFREMKVVDGTQCFSRPGTVLFMPPSDFAPMEVEGVRRWWLRLRGSEHAEDGYHPRIRYIRLNAVDVSNQQTQPEETFYVEITAPNMTFPLATQNILSAEVFVSEFGQHSRQQMRQMLERNPQDVRVEYDQLGEITGFSVRWQEVESFDSSKPGDRHYMLDRMRGVLIFGDGVHVRIPQAQPRPAISVRAISCDGSAGNVPAGAINRFFGNVLYVQSVYNPKATYAGSDLEDLEGARRRGADLLSGRGRLISQQDFTRAVRAFSKTIKKVKCLAGQDLEGRPDHRLVTIAVMTEDYDQGAGAFRNIQYALRQSLLERCEATLAPDCLVLAEPMYVEISVTAWVKAESTVGTFEIQEMILEQIRDFLDPMERSGHRGWEIGMLPAEGQLRMLLQSLRFPGYVERMIAVARYVDRAGVHESTLDQMPHMPFAIGINGRHKVYIQF